MKGGGGVVKGGGEGKVIKAALITFPSPGGEQTSQPKNHRGVR